MQQIRKNSWDDSFLINIKIIDEQHKRFFHLFDEIQNANQNGESFEVVSEYVHGLEKYVNYHFRIEEALMKHSNHPDLDYHLSQHDIFRKKVTEFKLACEYENLVILDQMVTFMRKWFLNHIFNDDRKFAPYVQQYFLEKEKAQSNYKS